LVLFAAPCKLSLQVKLDYVSCSPLRVPIARLAAAQAFLKAKKA
jgi:pyruvate,orthophosphate dikinase